LGAVDAGMILLIGIVPYGKGLAAGLELFNLLGPGEAHPPEQIHFDRIKIPVSLMTNMILL
jgi:hypothetical protein